MKAAMAVAFELQKVMEQFWQLMTPNNLFYFFLIAEVGFSENVLRNLKNQVS